MSDTGFGLGFGFGGVLQSALEAFGPLCVGIDPHDFLLDEWGLPSSAAGVREFGLKAVDAAAGRAGIVKPQVAFFERFGSAGYAALEEVLAAARSAGLITIADAKRGDIDTSLAGYAEAWLTPGAPLEADAVTINPFQGVGSLASAMEYATANGKGMFVLAATSNPEAARLQSARVQQANTTSSGSDQASLAIPTVSRAIIDDVSAFNAGRVGEGPVGSIGVVIGATIDFAALGVDVHTAHSPALPVLAPGFGHQGALGTDVRRLFGSLAPYTLVSESRSLLQAGPRGLATAIDARAAELRAALV
ncbi:orotidine-5'-phosphate decarboxylase [Gryllotalpicola protaetiae]|uniref:Orotidine-5'-phosphate decarboxylase n=1 Tax=Gryllotalpicola protaetiae TaxID=2419771 RepID=A0A387BVG2_9MICO|nr:orotidine-5'-phosphate decarboxylase [Gryllotalpicola protaetiae]AYG04929.1 orotidine-5'-phosphate decarboxylase [Gryllotalpicola protaetiae]